MSPRRNAADLFIGEDDTPPQSTQTADVPEPAKPKPSARKKATAKKATGRARGNQGSDRKDTATVPDQLRSYLTERPARRQVLIDNELHAELKQLTAVTRVTAGDIASLAIRQFLDEHRKQLGQLER